MTGRLVPYVLVVGLAATLGGAGCSRTTTQYNHRVLRSIKVSGTVRWQGRPAGEAVVRAFPEPRMRYSSGGYLLELSGRTSAVEPYELDGLAMEKEVTATTVTRQYRISRRPSLSNKTRLTVARSGDKPQCYVVLLEPPPGWEVTPAEYRVSKDTANADFVLRRKTSP